MDCLLIRFLLNVCRGDFSVLSVSEDFCYIRLSSKLPCFVHFRGFLLYVSRGDFPALSILEDFCSVTVEEICKPALSILEDFCCMTVEEISLLCPFQWVLLCVSRGDSLLG